MFWEALIHGGGVAKAVTSNVISKLSYKNHEIAKIL